MNQQIVTPPASTVVEVSGVLEETGETLTTDISIGHPSGIAEGQILAAAWQQFKQLGGILKDVPGVGMTFYMASKFKAPFTFTTKKIMMVGS